MTVKYSVQRSPVYKYFQKKKIGKDLFLVCGAKNTLGSGVSESRKMLSRKIQKALALLQYFRGKLKGISPQAPAATGTSNIILVLTKYMNYLSKKISHDMTYLNKFCMIDIDWGLNDMK